VSDHLTSPSTTANLLHPAHQGAVTRRQNAKILAFRYGMPPVDIDIEDSAEVEYWSRRLDVTMVELTNAGERSGPDLWEIAFALGKAGVLGR